jgi:tetratricopeptide (TPR) repeat protein
MEKLLNELIATSRRLSAEGRQHEAIFDLEHVATEALNILGVTYFERSGAGKPSLDYLDMAMKLDRGNWMVHSNRAHILNKLSMFEEASEAAEKAIHWCGGASADPYYNAGVIFANLKRPEKSLEYYERAISMAPDNHMCRFNYGCELLKYGNHEKGWKEYEHRLDAFEDLRKIEQRFRDSPRWDGTKANSLLIYSEQGIGDLIQYIRYLPEVKKRVSHVTVEAQEALGPILKDFPGIDRLVLRDHVNWPTYDQEFNAHASICSLPYIFYKGPETVPGKPYMKAPQREPRPEFDTDKKKIGIVWAGNPGHPSDNQRSFHLNWFRGLSEMEDVTLFSLQKDAFYLRDWNGQLVNLLSGAEGMKLVDLGPELKDFGDCAFFIQNMDLIVTADTSVAHLAAAMGKEVWMVISTAQDWRWMEGTDRTPWYPTMRIFRQKTRGDWKSAFDRVNEEVSKFQPRR